ncbi:hypothetical protein GCM10027423_01590 [Spirosoma arcticum]
MAIANPMAMGMAVIATIRPALKSRYTTVAQFALVRSSQRESKKVKNNFSLPAGVVGNSVFLIGD